LPSGIRFYHGDHLGSVTLVTDGSGAVVERTLHQPFGAVHQRDVATRPGFTPTPKALVWGFTGQREDARNGLLLFPARPYDPELGRFLQPDPFVQSPSDPQSFNRFSYVRNSPLVFVDPSGYFLHHWLFGGWSGREEESPNSSRIFLPVGPFFVAYDPQKEEVMVGLWAGGPGGHGEVGVFYNWERNQAGVYAGGYTEHGSGEGRLYYDFRENDVQASIELQSQHDSFFANTDGQRSLNGQSLKGPKASQEIRLTAARAGQFDDSNGFDRPIIIRTIPGPSGAPVPIVVNPRTGRASVGFPSSRRIAPPDLGQALFGNPARALRVMGRTFSETGHPVVGRMFGMAGMVLEPGGPGKITGMIAGGNVGARLGGSVLGPLGGIAGGFFGGSLGAAIGGYADDPSAEYLNYGE